MPVKVTLEYDELPQELSALEQHHNAGVPAQEVGYAPVDPLAAEPAPEFGPEKLEHLAQHPEDFQLHNAGRPAVETGGGHQVAVPQEWDPDPGKH